MGDYMTPYKVYFSLNSEDTDSVFYIKYFRNL